MKVVILGKEWLLLDTGVSIALVGRDRLMVAHRRLELRESCYWLGYPPYFIPALHPEAFI